MIVKTVESGYRLGFRGAIGAVLRFFVSNGIYRLVGRDFPYGTLIVNVIGSFLIGYFFVLFLERLVASEAIRLAVVVGLLGSFTTFSAFSFETLNLLNAGAYLKASMNIVLSVGLCISMTWLGVWLARLYA